MADKVKYRVLSNIRMDGKDYKKGDIIEMEPKQAQAIPWAVAPAPAPDKKG